MIVTTAVEAWHECVDELKPLFTPHWHELALNQDKVPLDPDWDYYLQREAAGQLLCVTIREKGSLIGYFIGLVHMHPHYRTCRTLTMDVFWLHPDFREGDSLERLEGTMVAAKLFDAVKAEALRRGVQRPFFGSKWHKDASAMFEEMGLERVDTYYSGWWGDEPRAR